MYQEFKTIIYLFINQLKFIKMTAIKELAIVKKVMEVLKLDEAGKINTFFQKEVKTFNRYIDGLKANKEVLTLEFQQKENKLNDDIEDAKEALENAYTSITMEDVRNNEAMSNFSNYYWENISSKEKILKRLEKQLEELKESHKKDMEDKDDQIAKYKTRIYKITK